MYTSDIAKILTSIGGVIRARYRLEVDPESLSVFASVEGIALSLCLRESVLDATVETQEDIIKQVSTLGEDLISRTIGGTVNILVKTEGRTWRIEWVP